MRPLIGITTYVTRASYGYWTHDTALLPIDYVNAVDRAGGRPLLIPPVRGGVEETLDALAGLILSGGSDLDPELYGEDPHPETFGVDRLRDDAELELLTAALERELPVLGICRGIQVLNVGRGGKLHQHLPELVGHEGHKKTPAGDFLEHDVAIEPETRLSGLLGSRSQVMSHHHQGLRVLGEGLVAAAHADDGAIEAIELPGAAFALGVLWHPEVGADPALFEALVKEARRYAVEAAAPRGTASR